MNEKRHYPVVCLCGSTRFKEQFLRVQRDFTLRGYIVLSVGLFGHADDVTLTREKKKMLDDMHKRKIDMAEYVYIINVGGYIGESTRSEIMYAMQQKKRIGYPEQRAMLQPGG